MIRTFCSQLPRYRLTSIRKVHDAGVDVKVPTLNADDPDDPKACLGAALQVEEYQRLLADVRIVCKINQNQYQSALVQQIHDLSRTSSLFRSSPAPQQHLPPGLPGSGGCQA